MVTEHGFSAGTTAWAESQRALYDEVAAHYDEAIPAHVMAHYLAKRVALVRSLVPAGATVLDVGCGTGTLDAALRAAGYRLVGSDASFGMLRQLRLGGRGTPVCGMGERLPFVSESFALAITVATLHHISEPERVAATLSEMCRVVQPGGAVVVWDHNPVNPYWPLLMKRVPQDTGEERLVPQEEIVGALSRAGITTQHIHAKRSGLVPDFTPPALLGLVQALEQVVERTPGANIFCAHNVVVARKH